MEIQQITNPSLVMAMQNMKADDTDDNRNIFINAMINASYLVPAIIDPAPENNVIPEGTTISLYSMKSDDGKSFMVVFTDPEEMKKWEKVEIKQTLVNRFEDIKQIVLKGDAGYEGFIINPFNENIAINKKLLERVDAHTRQANVKMEKINNENGSGLTPAKDVKAELITDLCRLMGEMSQIEAAYMMETMRPGTDVPTKVVVVEFEGDLRATFDSVAMAANKHLSKGESIGFMPASDKVAGASIVGVEPFYKK